MTVKFEDCKQQVNSLETQNARVKRSVNSIIDQQAMTPSEATSGNQQDDFMWEAGLQKILSSAKKDTVNFKSVNFNGLGMITGIASDNRLLFMPHSDGIYLALVLKDAATLEREQEDQLEMMSHISSSGAIDDQQSTSPILSTQVSGDDSS